MEHAETRFTSGQGNLLPRPLTSSAFPLFKFRNNLLASANLNHKSEELVRLAA
ncbi:MAG: hypothetical protein RLZZ04_2984 [Cyanobacteriota bacterium]|jgi:hypothetical protein